MKIAILGAVCFDEIFPLDGERRESFGGILYNAAALASILEGADDVDNIGDDLIVQADTGDSLDFGQLPELLDDGGINLTEVLGQLDEGEGTGLDAFLDNEVSAGGIERVLNGLADTMGNGEDRDQ